MTDRKIDLLYKSACILLLFLWVGEALAQDPAATPVKTRRQMVWIRRSACSSMAS